MMTRPLWLHAAHPALVPATPWLRRGAAALLHGASRGLQRLAHRLAASPARHRAAVRTAVRTPVFEFHAEAGAPEGALYVDGQLVGHLAGVSRL